MSLRFLVAVVLVLLGVASGARGDVPPEAVTHDKAGRERFVAGDYVKALEAYQQSYDLSRAPEMLFNIAQTNRVLGRYDDALGNYRRYLAESRDGASFRDAAERHIWEIARYLVAAREKGGPEVAKPLGLVKAPAVNILFLASLGPEATLREVLRLRAADRHEEALDLAVAAQALERERRVAEEQARQAAKQEKADEENHLLRRDLGAAEERWQRAKRGLRLGGGVVALATGAILLGVGGYLLHNANELRDATWINPSQMPFRIDDLLGGQRTAAGLLIAPGVLAVLGGVALLAWPSGGGAAPAPAAPRVQVVPAINGVVVQGRF